MAQVRVEMGMYVPLTSAMASVSGRAAYGNSVFIQKHMHSLLPNAKTTIETISSFS